MVTTTESAAKHEAEVPIASIEIGDRLLKPDTQLIDELAKDIDERGLLQRIGVRARTDGKHDLIWGRHRYEAAAKLGWASIPAVVYPSDTPDRDLAILERVENLKRRELATEERDLHRAELAALLKEQQAAETINQLTVPTRAAAASGESRAVSPRPRGSRRRRSRSPRSGSPRRSVSPSISSATRPSS
jgi:ParB-like chromosome segregation protein Spo0J